MYLPISYKLINVEKCNLYKKYIMFRSKVNTIILNFRIYIQQHLVPSIGLWSGYFIIYIFFVEINK